MQVSYGIRFAALLLLMQVSFALAGTVLERQSVTSEEGQLVHYTVYLPDGYEQDSRAYPVVYLLHGYSGEDTDWVRYGDAAFIVDRLIKENAIPPLILVMPDGDDSWYVNSPEYGRYEDALTDLVTHIDSTYRTIPERASRAIGGLSMGGYGSARLAIKYPELFAAASVMSGAIFETVPPGLAAILTDVFDDPLDMERYQANLPSTLLRRWNEETQKPAFYLTVGDDDTVTPYQHSVALHRALLSAGAEAQLRITDGTHAWAVWQDALDDTLLFFASEFERYY